MPDSPQPCNFKAARLQLLFHPPPSLSSNPAECLKKLGNDAFVAKNYTLALAHYNAAVELCATKHVRTLAPAA